MFLTNGGLNGNLAQLAPPLPLVFAGCYTISGQRILNIRDFYERSGTDNACVYESVDV
jgi:hypothetical protein